jgi:hypothetical protein
VDSWGVNNCNDGSYHAPSAAGVPPMCILSVPQRVASAAAVFCGRYGDVTRLAHQRGVFRQTLYREAHAVARALDPEPVPPAQADWRQRLAQAQAEQTRLRQQLAQATVLDDAKQAAFASTAQALGVSLSASRALLAVLMGKAAPSVARLGRRARQAGRRAGAARAVLDAYARPRAKQVAADEIFVGNKPVLMTVEQHSLCWLGGRRAANREGQEWAAELGQLANVEQVTRDGGQGLRNGLALVNADRKRNGQPAVADQEDHFHLLHRLRRGLAGVRAKAQAALGKAERAQEQAQRDRRTRKLPGGRWAHVAKCWRQAEQAMDRWSAQERAMERLRAGLRLFTAQGELNTPARAEAELRAALAELTGPEWKRWKRRRIGPETFTFLTRVHEQLAALPIPAALRQAAVRVEGLKRQAEALRGEGPSAGALRGVLLAWSLVLSLSGEAGGRAVALVQGVLAGAWRASSLVEGLNSVVRMQQRRQKRLTQGLLDLKRLYWNTHTFVAGRRKKTSPYERLGVRLPEGDWWQLLNKPPEQLRQELSALNQAA